MYIRKWVCMLGPSARPSRGFARPPRGEIHLPINGFSPAAFHPFLTYNGLMSIKTPMRKQKLQQMHRRLPISHSPWPQIIIQRHVIL